MREYPPILTGTATEQIQQIRDYLIRLGVELDDALGQTPTGAGTVSQASFESYASTVVRRALRGAKLAAWPVGSVMLTSANTSPADSIGGTWTSAGSVGTLYAWTRTA